MKAFDAYVVSYASFPVHPLKGSLIIVQRIFKYGTRKKYALQSVALVSALASGVGLALVELVFGKFIIITVAFTTGAASGATFREEASRLA